MMLKEEDPQHEFKDCFLSGVFPDDWGWLRDPNENRGKTSASLVFYPHGSLALCRNQAGQEQKISSEFGNNLLETVLKKWKTEEVVPLFVCEGTTEQKVASIRSSYYLSAVYREVLKSRRDSLVVYGWGFWEQDIHLLERMKDTGIKRVAVSVFGEKDRRDLYRIKCYIESTLGKDVKVEFFKSESEGCWNHPTSDSLS